MKTAACIKSSNQLDRLKILVACALALTFVFYVVNLASADTVAHIETQPTNSVVTLNNGVITEVLSDPNIVSKGVTSPFWEFLVNDGSSAAQTPTTAAGMWAARSRFSQPKR